jgi:hypothetical protein
LSVAPSLLGQDAILRNEVHRMSQKPLTFELARQHAADHLLRDLVLNAIDDFVPFSAVLWEVNDRLAPASDDAALQEAGVILGHLVNGEFIVVGELNEARAVIDPWPGSGHEVVSRALRALRSEPDATWFIATEKAREWHARYRKLLDELKRA